MRDEYKKILQNKFANELKQGCFHYEKGSNTHIVLYKWDDGFAYKAAYKCLSKKMTFEQACSYIEKTFTIKEQWSEYYLFTDRMKEWSVEGVSVRELTLRDEDLLERMKKQCDKSEVEVAQIMIHDIHVIGAFKDDALIGVSSILDLWDAYDIGIIVHPSYRNQGISSLLVAYNSKWTLEQNKVCMYRCDAHNIGSHKTALRLGFRKEVDIIVYKIENEEKE